MNARELVAWNVRRLRVERGIAQEALAVDAEIDRTYVSRMERGMENPTVGVLERIAIALGVPITDFFVVPKPGAKLPPLLPGGRKAATKRRDSKS